MRIYLSHFKRDFASFNAVYAGDCGIGMLPSRTTVGVAALGLGALVEVDQGCFNATKSSRREADVRGPA